MGFNRRIGYDKFPIIFKYSRIKLQSQLYYTQKVSAINLAWTISPRDSSKG